MSELGSQIVNPFRWFCGCRDDLYDCRDAFAVVEMAYTFVEMVSRL